MKALTLVYKGTDQAVELGDIFYVKGEQHAYRGDWDILDTARGCGTLVVETDKAIVDAYKLGVELVYSVQ